MGGVPHHVPMIGTVSTGCARPGDRRRIVIQATWHDALRHG